MKRSEQIFISSTFAKKEENEKWQERLIVKIKLLNFKQQSLKTFLEINVYCEKTLHRECEKIDRL